MQLVKLKRIWAGLLVLLVPASYTWPGFGMFFVCSSVVLLGVANGLLSIQSKKLGLVTGSSASVLVLATSLGAGLSAWQVVLFALIGAIAGYAFAAVPVELGGGRQSGGNDDDDDDRASEFKAGGGGDFGGGGAGGKY